MRFVDTSNIHAFTWPVWAPPMFTHLHYSGSCDWVPRSHDNDVGFWSVHMKIAASRVFCETLTNGECPWFNEIHIWQSRVQIKDYTAVYFDRIATFKVPYHWTFIKGRAHTYVLNRYLRIYEALMSPALNRSSAIRHFEHSNEIKLCNRI